MTTTPALPCLRRDVRLVEQVFGGERSAVVKDPETGKYFRMQASETRVLRAFDGTRRIAEVVRLLAEQGMQVSEAAVDAFARSCARLGLLERSFEERTTLELERLRAERNRRRSPFRGELMRMRWSFGDADRLITRTMPWLRWCFGRGFVVASLVTFLAYFLVIAIAWPEFSRAVLDVADLSKLSGGRIATYVLVTLGVTAIHELGHAYTCKRYGGEVSELGFMIIYLQPAFYCNVNDAWSFPELRARLWVTAAGMWIQMVVAGIAAVAWWLAAPGTLLSEVMLAAMIAGGLTSVLTNANPLLPLDGYFALTDWLAIPNLRQRGIAWASWWVRHRLLGLDVPEPVASPREARALRWYGALASLYITGMLTLFSFIVLRAASRWLGGAGLAIALAWLLLMLGKPLRSWGQAVVDGVRLRAARVHGWRRRLVLGAIALMVIGALPWPARVRGEGTASGVVEASIIAPMSGLVTAVLVHDGQRIAAGTPLLRLTDIALAAEVERLTRVADSLAAGERAARASLAPGEAAWYAASRRAASAQVADLATRATRVLRAPVAGEIVTVRPERIMGRRVAAGETVLAIGDADSVEVRIALAGSGSTRVRAGQGIRLFSFAGTGATTHSTVIAVAARGAASRGAVEVRAHLPRSDAWRPGARAEAQVLLGQTTIAGAVWRSMLERVRPETFL